MEPLDKENNSPGSNYISAVMSLMWLCLSVQPWKVRFYFCYGQGEITDLFRRMVEPSVRNMTTAGRQNHH